MDLAWLPKVTSIRTSAISRSLEETLTTSNVAQLVGSDVINDITTHPTDKDKFQTSTVIEDTAVLY